jgi:transglutaminase-like putative cysteine protease
MDYSVFPYLYPSRYCQSDKLYRLANNLFGHIVNPFEKVITLTNWINKNVQYLSGSTNSQTSAFDTVTEQSGVCRDFAHLGIALCRALTIPARYFTGYAYHLKPADFHACFEAYIGNEWVLFDATRLVPLNGLIKIASGRDAADTAIANIFGNVIFTSMQVSCELAEDGFEPFYYEQPGLKGLSYL